MWTNWARQQLLFLLLCIMLTQSSRSDSCDMCRPGTYLVEKCKEGLPHTTKCEQCPSGSYTKYYNLLGQCLRHRHCGRNMVAHLGNGTTNTVCTCKEGYRMPFGLEIELCLRNALCPPGTGVTEQGNECKRCHRGFYSDQHSHTDFCRPWTNCTANGLIVVERGSRTRDVTCGHQNLTSTGEKMLPTGFVSPKVGMFTTPTQQQGLQSNINDISSQPEKDASALEMRAIMLGLLSFLAVCATSLLALLWFRRNNRRCSCMCMWKRKKPHYTVPVQAAHSEDRYGGIRIVEPEVQVHEPLHVTIQESAQTYRADLVICPDINDHDGEYSKSPKTRPKSKPTTWSSSSSLPTGQNTSAVPTDSTRLTSESSEEYMHEMQTLMAEEYSTVLSASGAEHLAAELGPSWRQVAKSLGIKQEQIDQILNENRQNLERQIFKMLHCWQRNRTGRASISELYGALLACNQEQLCRRLQEMEHGSSKSEETKVYCV